MLKLNRHKREQSEHIMSMGGAYERNDFVFCTDGGAPIRYGNLTKRHFHKILEEAGLKDFGFTTFDTQPPLYSYQRVLTPKIVSERLGHASITLTLDTYSHVLPGMQEDATKKLGKVLFG